MSTYFEPELGNVTDLKNKMQELGFEYVNPVSVYVDTERDWLDWSVLNFYIFAKSIGNIAVFRVANLIFYTDFERISPTTLCMRLDGKHIYKEVNAVFNNRKGKRCYFYLSY